jgi:hypothetical protein
MSLPDQSRVASPDQGSYADPTLGAALPNKARMSLRERTRPWGARLFWLKVKNPNAPGVKREAEEDWGR